MDIIQLLPDSVANQIAAGEVIQRPASVAKELMENAIDADAKTIHVLVVDAGRTSIQVIDDGKGMSDTDARLSFERHATSKIRQAEDLFALHTMGFRGEALASIAAVAQVDLKTRLRGSDIGSHLCIAGSRFVSQEPCSCPEGSNFLIENLFFNVPARRKFLKSNTTEFNNIVNAFERIALVYPQITFTLHNNDFETFNLKAGSLRQRIVDICGKKLNQDLLPVEAETTMCHVYGFVGKPESAKKKSARQYFFVNGRYMRHPYFHKAVMGVYERLIQQGEQIPYFIYLDVPAEDLDVNIHPTKTEIKFENEQAIFQILSAAVRQAIGKFSDVPTIDFDTEGKPDIPIYDPLRQVDAPQVKYNPQYNPFKETAMPKYKRGQHVPDNWEQLYDDIKSPVSPNLSQPQIFEQQSAGELPNDITDKSPMHYQYKGRYVMTAVKSGLMVVDQHRAHIRVLYEKYLRQQQEHRSTSQKLLFPEVVTLPNVDEKSLLSILDELEVLGFDLTNLGGGSYAVGAIPAGLDGIDAISLVSDMFDNAMGDEVNVGNDLHHRLALSLACHAAIPYGQVLGNDEMETLVNDLFACENVNYTPDGRPVLAILPQSTIEQLF